MASVLSVGAFDFFFVPPRLTFAVSDTQYLVTFAVMLIAGLVISTLTAHVKFQAESARQREQRTAALYFDESWAGRGPPRRKSGRSGREAYQRGFDSEVFLLFPDPTRHGPVTVSAGPSPFPGTLTDHDLGVAQWVFDNGERAGRGTDTLPSASSLFVPLRRAARSSASWASGRQRDRALFSPSRSGCWRPLPARSALAEERIRSAQDAQQAKLQVEAEQLAQLAPEHRVARFAYPARRHRRRRAAPWSTATGSIPQRGTSWPNRSSRRPNGSIGWWRTCWT